MKTNHPSRQTNLPGFKKNSFDISRRYNDFVWLRELLVEKHEGIIVPPIPEKSILGAFEKLFNVDAQPLIAYRKRALERFLTRIGHHPM